MITYYTNPETGAHGSTDAQPDAPLIEFGFLDVGGSVAPLDTPSYAGHVGARLEIGLSAAKSSGCAFSSMVNLSFLPFFLPETFITVGLSAIGMLHTFRKHIATAGQISI